MHRLLRTLALPGCVGLSLLAMGACKDDKDGCQVDTDCPQSYICRDSVCGATQFDGGGLPVDDGGTGSSTCVNEGATCGANADCCTNICTNGACASSTTQPSCVGLSGLCQDDCCSGYSCVKGVCQ